MDIDISLVEDSRRLAKQCKMADLMEALENKCKQVYEYGKTAFLVHIYTSHTCYLIDTTCQPVSLNSWPFFSGALFDFFFSFLSVCFLFIFLISSFQCPTSQESV